MSAQPDDDRVVVVGVSPTTGSPDALSWAAAEADRRHGRLRAVTAWRPPRTAAATAARPPASAPVDPTDAQRAADSALRASVRRALGAEVAVEYAAVRGRAATVLLAAAAEAQLLVLGAPRTANPAPGRPGLLAPQLVYRAACPVVTLPPAGQPRSRLSRTAQSARRLLPRPMPQR